MGERVIVTEVEPRQVGTPGGARLRALRQSRGRPQLWVEAEAELGTGYLQRLECGRIRQPARATIARVLAALEAHYGEAREVLEAFGYCVPAPLPAASDRAWVRQTCQPDLDDIAFPAYALDGAARLVAWNAFLPRLLGLRSVAPLPVQLRRQSMLASWFDPATRLGALVSEPDTLYPALARALRYELDRYRDEAWPAALLSDLQRLPRFRVTWLAVMREPAGAGARARVPVALQVPHAGRLTFRLAAEPLAPDPRFRLLFLYPADAATLRWCEDEGDG